MYMGQFIKIGVSAVFAGTLLAACGTSTSSAVSSNSGCHGGPTVTSHGEGSAVGTPDLLTIQLSINTHGSTASLALNSNSTSTQALIKQLRASGIVQNDLQTTGLSLFPTYASPSAIITGYQVSNTVTARITDIASAGTIIDNAVKAAGNAIRVNRFTFSVLNTSKLYSQARAQGVKQAASEATAMAQAAGRQLGPLCSLNDNLASVIPSQKSPYGSATSSTSDVPIQAGSEKINASVTAVYQLKS